MALAKDKVINYRGIREQCRPGRLVSFYQLKASPPWPDPARALRSLGAVWLLTDAFLLLPLPSLVHLALEKATEEGPGWGFGLGDPFNSDVPLTHGWPLPTMETSLLESFCLEGLL